MLFNGISITGYGKFTKNCLLCVIYIDLLWFKVMALMLGMFISYDIERLETNTIIISST